MGGTPFGTTANRPASPAVGQTYYNGTLGYLEMYTASGWTAAAKAIPFGNTAARPANPVIGEPYFNGQEARLELYTSTGWQNIVQETPAVVSISGQLNETTTSTLTINGTNFAAGAIAYVVGTSGVETVANTTTLVSVVEITATFPALAVADAPYDVKVVNPSNLYGVLYETLGVNDKPIWSTTAGTLGTFTELDVISITVAATDATDSTNSALQYSLVSGTLPTGLSLNSTTGVISGTLANVVSNTTYSFTLGASDSRNTVQSRAFSITVNDRSPVWSTSSVLPVFTKNSAYSTSISATDDDSGAITYSLFSGSLPTGLTLSSAGVISGTPTSSINASFTIRATVTSSGTTADRDFTMSNVGPNWTTTAGAITSATLNTAYSLQLSATEDSVITYSVNSGTLPTGLSLSSSGLISGTPTVGGNYSFVLRVTDDAGNFSNRSFTLGVLQTYTSTFTSSGTFTAPSTLSSTNGTVNAVEVFVIGGGGGTIGPYAGGGGAGGASYHTSYSVTPGSSYSVVVGGGGNGNNNGSDSSFNSAIIGYGGGYSSSGNGNPGGCSGGNRASSGAQNSYGTATQGAGGTTVYGNRGGDGGEGGPYEGGGGGGIGGVGNRGKPQGNGNGGAGLNFFGTFYGGGGGGWNAHATYGGDSSPGAGGTGGGGTGGAGGNGNNNTRSPVNGSANTGGGAGGNGASGGTSIGGSGIVIVRYNAV